MILAQNQYFVILYAIFCREIPGLGEGRGVNASSKCYLFCLFLKERTHAIFVLNGF